TPPARRHASADYGSSTRMPRACAPAGVAAAYDRAASAYWSALTWFHGNTLRISESAGEVRTFSDTAGRASGARLSLAPTSTRPRVRVHEGRAPASSSPRAPQSLPVKPGRSVVSGASASI